MDTKSLKTLVAAVGAGEGRKECVGGSGAAPGQRVAKRSLATTESGKAGEQSKEAQPRAEASSGAMDDLYSQSAIALHQLSLPATGLQSRAHLEPRPRPAPSTIENPADDDLLRVQSSL